MADQKLIVAATGPSPASVKKALAEGANPNAMGSGGYSALYLAAGRDAMQSIPGPVPPESTRLLLEAGAKVDAKSKGETPLQHVLEIALYYHEHSRNAFKNILPVIMLLLKRGADMPRDLLPKVPEEFREQVRAQVAENKRQVIDQKVRASLVATQKGLPAELGRKIGNYTAGRRKSVRRRKTKSRRRTSKH